MLELIIIALSYMFGSIPFALVIGKVFFKKDVRNYGSGNLGGSNAGRVLGKKIGITVILLDASKALISTLIAGYLSRRFDLYIDLRYFAGLACVIGHCYPVFASFKGGKAVSTAAGLQIAIVPKFVLPGLVIFMLVLYKSKYVSLASIVTATFIIVATFFMNISLTGKIVNIIVMALLIYRHKSNIGRLLNHTENKVTYLG
ncbi:MAG: glycerol-3-phosphate 1-O-acyltransferase PlsY [Erysipelotrichaceae bacterium]|nr:glycerol-3-phosphate 1-O-acyltransferase PlsY [Erysipelotrichaceae bacterium]